MSYTTDTIITELKLQGMIPTSQETITTANFLTFLQNEMQTYIMPMVLRSREEFYVKYEDMVMTENLERYAIPSRSIGSKVRDIYIFDSLDPTTANVFPVGRIEPENIPQLAFGAMSRSSVPQFYIENNDIMMIPKPNGASKLMRVKFFMRPSSLVLEASCAKITAIDKTAKTVTVSAVPATITALTPIDFVHATPSFDILDWDVTPADLTGTTFTFTDALPSTLAVGDYICLAGESCIPIIPPEVFPVLKEKCLYRLLKTLGDFDGANMVAAGLPELEKSAMALIDNRIHGKCHKLINGNSTWGTNRRLLGRNFSF